MNKRFLTDVEWQDRINTRRMSQKFSDQDLDDLIKIAGTMPIGQIELVLYVEDDSSLNGCQVVTVTDRRTALWYRLEGIAKHAELITENKNKHKVPSEVRKKMVKLKGLCRKAQEVMSDHTCAKYLKSAFNDYANKKPGGFIDLWSDLDPVQLNLGSEYPPYTDFRGDIAYVRTKEVIDALQNIADIADAEAYENVAINKAEGKPHAGNVALNDVVSNLCRLWIAIFEKELGTSVDPVSGKAGGPLIRFTKSVLQHLGFQQTCGSIRAYIRAVMAELDS